jgi:chromosome segregation ATPase
VPSSAGESGYAERYPTAVDGVNNRLGEQEQKAREDFGKFAAYPDALKDPSWTGVGEVVSRADAAGKSASYAREAEQGRLVAQFFEEEKQDIHRRVGGAVDYTAKQKNCESGEIAGAAVSSVDKAVEKQLEERLREHNEAHRYIDDHEEELGKANTDKLREQADEISRASFLVNVGVWVTRQELEQMIAEAGDVRSTLDRTIEESNAKLQEPDAKPAEKKQAQARLDAAKAAKDTIDAEVQEAQQSLEKIDERIQALQDEYEKALVELEKKIDEKASAQPVAAAE